MAGSPTPEVRRESWDHWVIPLLAWTTMAWVVNRTQEIVFSVVKEDVPWSWTLLLDSAISTRGKGAWDTGFYLRVASEGYVPGQDLEAVFPGFALAIRALTPLTGDGLTAGILVSAVCGLGATLVFWQWVGDLGRPMRERLVALALFVCYPYGFVIFGVAYSDSLLLFATLSALVLVHRRRYALAGLAGAVATFSRPNSLILVPVLLVIALEDAGALTMGRRIRSLRFDRRKVDRRSAWLLLSLAGIGSYSAWLTFRYHDPFFFWSAQASYGHRPLTDPLNWLKVNLLDPPMVINSAIDVVNEIVAVTLLIVGAVVAPAIGRRFGWGYGLLVLGLVVTTWGTAFWFAPAGRYLLPAMPVLVAAVAPALARRSSRTIAVSIGALALLTLTFAAGFADAYAMNW